MDPATAKTPGTRPKPVPGTFKVVVLEPAGEAKR
jgi:hypothetical protein